MSGSIIRIYLSGVQVVSGKTVLVPNASSAFAPIAEFSAIGIENLSAAPDSPSLSEVCFDVEDLQPIPPTIVASSCPA